MSQLAFDIALDCEQDPAYPVYVDASVIMGMTHTYNEGRKGFDNIEYMMCRPETQFFPDLSKVQYLTLQLRIKTAYMCLSHAMPLSAYPYKAIAWKGMWRNDGTQYPLLLSYAREPGPSKHSRGAGAADGSHLFLLTQQPDRRGCHPAAAD